MKTNLFKVVALLCLSLLFFACGKENEITINQELQAEEFLALENPTFVSMTKAADIASAFFGQLKNDPFTKSESRTVSTKVIRDSKNQNAPSMYVVNYESGGFVIVGATKDYYPILAYSENNSFELNENIEEMNGIAIWLEETQEDIRKSEAFDEITKTEMRSLWRKYEPITNEITSGVKTKVPTPEQDDARDYRISQLNSLGYTVYSLSSAYANGLITLNQYDNWGAVGNVLGTPDYTLVATGSNENFTYVGPLLQTAWAQWSPFNSYVPLISGQDPPLGCVAVAVGQLMAYHGWPNYYNWGTMLSQGGNSTVTQSFLYNVALDVNMVFGLDGSSAYDSNARDALKNTYGYSSTISMIDHNSSTVRAQLSLNPPQPVYMRGERYDQVKKKYIGHAWVCDGHNSSTYSDFYFVEFLLGSSGSYYYSSKNNIEPAPSLQSPAVYNTLTIHEYSMNWGHEGNYNGWFVGEYVNMNYNDRDYQHNRKEIVNIKKP